MELFFDIIIEYKLMKQTLKLEDDQAKNYYFTDTMKDEIKKLFDNWDGQIYCLEINKIKIITPSKIVCYNYIYENFDNDENFHIYNLRNIN